MTGVRTVIETPTFQRQAEKAWSEDERLGFIDWIALNAEARLLVLVMLRAKADRPPELSCDLHAP